MSELYVRQEIMKNPHDPDNDDIMEWLLGGGHWPEQDWDWYVGNGRNDQLVLQLANDLTCKKREFFVHALYHIVGDYYEWNREEDVIRNRINGLMVNVSDSSHPDLIEWKAVTARLFAGEIQFTLDDWVNHMFQDS